MGAMSNTATATAIAQGAVKAAERPILLVGYAGDINDIRPGYADELGDASWALPPEVDVEAELEKRNSRDRKRTRELLYGKGLSS